MTQFMLCTLNLTAYGYLYSHTNGVFSNTVLDISKYMADHRQAQIIIWLFSYNRSGGLEFAPGLGPVEDFTSS